MATYHPNHVLLTRTAAHLGRWCVYLSIPTDDVPEAVKAAPCLKDLDHPGDMIDAVVNGRAFLSYWDEADAREAFNTVVGDDGPTKTNPYDGPCRIYACLISPTSGIVTENT